MAFVLYIDKTCPKCRQPIRRTTIEAHPSRTDIAIQNFHCADCGHLKSVVLSLKPGKPPGHLAA
jgi:phage FluMu protein Com